MNDLRLKMDVVALGCGVVATLGIMAVAWNYILFAVVAAIVLYVFSTLFSGGISIDF